MRFCWLVSLVLLLSACEKPMVVHENDSDLVKVQTRLHDQKLVSINVMDRNGLSETITAKDRLKNFEAMNFLTSQPYQKVLRIYAKDKQGNSLSVITSYYPTGQIRQYLEAINGRANGRYLEWHPNGQKKLQATVLGGVADLDDKSQSGWAFDEKSLCWNEEGTLIASISYSRGVLEGKTCYYHVDGSLSEDIPYAKGEIEGCAFVYAPTGTILERTSYTKGLKEGESCGYWPSGKLAWQESWHEDYLQTGSYFEQDESTICQVADGSGKRCIFGDFGPLELQEYRQGKPEGEVLILDDKRTIVRRLHIKDGEKHGEEIYYWPNHPKIAKLSIEWVNGKMSGVVKTWYENGVQESSREMSNNAKQGLLTAWYKDGNLMLIEEYEKDRLIRGDYIKHGHTKPISQVIDGKGIATFYEADGNFRARIAYQDGKALSDEIHASR